MPGGALVMEAAAPRGRVAAAGPGERTDGYAAVDALVGLMILSSTIILALAASGQARQVSEAALEARRAQSNLIYLLETVAANPQGGEGVIDRFRWRLEVAPASSPAAGLKLCQVQAELKSLRSGRRYHAQTTEPCPKVRA